jgi:hypothetical protein
MAEELVTIPREEYERLTAQLATIHKMCGRINDELWSVGIEAESLLAGVRIAVDEIKKLRDVVAGRWKVESVNEDFDAHAIRVKLEELIAEGEARLGLPSVKRDLFQFWKERTGEFIKEAIDPEIASSFYSRTHGGYMETVVLWNRCLEFVRSLLIEIGKHPETYARRHEAALSARRVSTPAARSEENAIEWLTNAFDRFDLVVRQLRQRYNERTTLDVQDEYDAQDLFHSLLRLRFNDIRREDYVPIVAGAPSRIDFLLKPEKIAVELKHTRDSLRDKAIGEQISTDTTRYAGHPDVNTIMFFIYDPDGYVKNPLGLTADLEQPTSPRVIVVVRG